MMNYPGGWLGSSLMGLGLTLAVTAATPGVTRADTIGQAQEEFVRSSAAAEAALERAMREAAPEARPALERALDEVRRARERTVRALIAAREGPGASTGGRVRARDAVDRGTQTHLRVLQDALGRVPSEARPAIERALEVSRIGRETALEALQGGPAGAPGVREGPPPWARRGPPSGVPGGPPGGITGGPPSGRPGGPPVGLPGGPGPSLRM